VANKIDAAPAGILDDLSSGDRTVIPVSAEGELALRNASDAGVLDYDPGDDSFEITGDVTDEQQHGLETIQKVIETHGGTGVQTAINTAVYDVLDMITVFPVENESRWTDGQGNTLTDAFLLPRGATPKDLAYAVHSDIGDGYLHAIDARSNRRISEGQSLEEGDVIKIVSAAK
jgi:ribosome-binding ATPase YchF (GTP1/OBG family)